MLTVVLSVGFGDGLGWLVVMIGALLLGVIMVVMPAFVHPWTKKITGNDTIAIGHFGTLGYIAAGATGQAVGRRSKSTEHIKFPQGLKFLRDSMVATSLSMVLIYMVFSVWGLIALGILAAWLNPMFGLALILPGMVPHFFTGGGAGVFGNATGGRIGAMIGGFVNGVIITILPAILLLVLGDFGFANSTFGDADFGWFGTLVGVSVGGGTGMGIVLSILIAVVLVSGAIVFQIRVVDKGWVPGAKRDAWIAEEEAAEKAILDAEKARRKAEKEAAATADQLRWSHVPPAGGSAVRRRPLFVSGLAGHRGHLGGRRTLRRNSIARPENSTDQR